MSHNAIFKSKMEEIFRTIQPRVEADKACYDFHLPVFKGEVMTLSS
jgi:hypothetical protein